MYCPAFSMSSLALLHNIFVHLRAQDHPAWSRAALQQPLAGNDTAGARHSSSLLHPADFVKQPEQ